MTGRQRQAWLGVLLIVMAIMLGLIVRGAPMAADIAVMRGVALPVRDAGLSTAALIVTHVGDAEVRPFLLLAAGAGLLWQRHWQAVAVFLGGSLVSILLTSALKGHFDRMRPQLVPWLDNPSNASFPSGHSSNTLAILLLFALLAGGGWRTGLALALAGAVGVSRIVLGVHWPSDVLGGWLLGGGVALFALAVGQRFGIGASPGRNRYTP